MHTKEPVTVDGWYENTDGTVTEYTWRNGQLCTGQTVANWEAVPARDYAADDRASRKD